VKKQTERLAAELTIHNTSSLRPEQVKSIINWLVDQCINIAIHPEKYTKKSFKARYFFVNDGSEKGTANEDH
jgi:hypothetical protein